MSNYTHENFMECELTRLMKISVATSCVAFMLTACASTPPNPLSLDQRDQVFLKNVNVVWDLSEKEQAVEEKKDAKGKGQRQEGRAELEEKLKLVVKEEFINSPSGPDPITFDIAIKRYDRVGAAVGNVIGGNNILVANVRVKDSNDGQEIAVYEEVNGYYASNFGLVGAVVQAATKPDIPGLMAKSFSETLRKRFDSKKTGKK